MARTARRAADRNIHGKEFVTPCKDQRNGVPATPRLPKTSVKKAAGRPASKVTKKQKQTKKDEYGEIYAVKFDDENDSFETQYILPNGKVVLHNHLESYEHLIAQCPKI